VTPTFGGVLGLAAVAGVGLVGWWIYSHRNDIQKAGAKAAAAVGTAINPVSPDNLAYRGVNAVGAALTSNSNFSLGTWIYDVLHPDDGRSPTGVPKIVGATSVEQDKVQAALESATAAANSFGADTDNWFVG
jgi:phage tail tape-measure protein